MSQWAEVTHIAITTLTPWMTWSFHSFASSRQTIPTDYWNWCYRSAESKSLLFHQLFVISFAFLRPSSNIIKPSKPTPKYCAIILISNKIKILLNVEINFSLKEEGSWTHDPQLNLQNSLTLNYYSISNISTCRY